MLKNVYLVCQDFDDVRGANEVVSKYGSEWMSCLVDGDGVGNEKEMNGDPDFVGGYVGAVVGDVLGREGWVDFE